MGENAINIMNHMHTHGEESALDGLNTVGELVKKAKSIGSTALGLTDHGVMGAIPDFIEACEKEGIKAVPGCEAYMVENRHIQSDEVKRMKEYLCEKYEIKDNKGKPRMKALNDFLKKFKKQPAAFEDQAETLLQNYLIGGEDDLFSIFEVTESKEEKLESFKKDALEYISYIGNFHIVLLATNNQGLRDLYEIISDSHLKGFYSDPRTDLRFIRQHGLGNHIIATSACLGGYLPHLINNNLGQEALDFIEECKQTFKAFYLEKQAVETEDQYNLNRAIDYLAEKTNTPKIVTTDVHFANKEDHSIHDILAAASFGKCVQDEDRYVYSTDHYMKTYEEVKAIVDDEEAILNTVRIAEDVHVTLPKEPLFPSFPINGNETPEEYLKKKAWDSLFQFALRNSHINFDEYANRLNYELEVICSEGFSDYFLIEEDMIKETKKAGFLVGPGRGSGAGSLVCYVLGITTLDPIELDLLFERFLNPERAGYPDLDVDYSYSGTQFVQQYLKNKYGHDRVAQIGTKGTMAARASIRTTGKTLQYDTSMQDDFAKAIPGDPKMTLKRAYESEERVRSYANAYPDWWQAATQLEGQIKSFGVHAGGIVLSPEKLTNVVPLRKDKQGLATTMYDMNWIERLLVKFDILKLDTLDLIKLTMQNAGIWGQMDVEDIPLNDPKIFEEVYNQLHLHGVFQVESDLFRGIIDEMKPTSFKEISVIVALGRPGPLDLIPTYIARKFGREQVVYPFAELEEVLKETYGVWVYQEQVMKASQILGGLTLGQADMIRKGVAKKKYDLMGRWIELMIYGDDQYKEIHKERIQQYPNKEMIPVDEKGNPAVWVDYKFEEVPEVEGALKRGFDLNTLLDLQKQWIKFGEYCFNKAHSAAYAKISCMTAWLKAYYPAEFMAALLTNSEGKKDKNQNPKNNTYMLACEQMGIDILPPDVFESNDEWTVVTKEDGTKAIRYGLASIAGITEDSTKQLKNIGLGFVETFEDFLYRCAAYKDVLSGTTERFALTKNRIINLIKAGAFDSINSNRNKLLVLYAKSRGDDITGMPERTNKGEIISYERETLGASVSIKSKWEKIENGKENVQITGHIRTLSPFTSKKGDEHCRVMIETAEDEINCMLFNKNWMPLKESIIIGEKVTVKGDKSEDGKLLIKRFMNRELERYEVDMSEAGNS